MHSGVVERVKGRSDSTAAHRLLSPLSLPSNLVFSQSNLAGIPSEKDLLLWEFKEHDSYVGDTYAVQLRAASPPPPKLEDDVLANVHVSTGNTAGNKANEAPKITTKIIMFPKKENMEKNQKAFEREMVVPMVFNKRSALTLALGGKSVDVAAPAAAPAGDDDAGGYRRRARRGPAGQVANAGPPMVDMNVHVGEVKMKLRVLENATVEQAMAAVLKQYVAEAKKPDLTHPVTDAYLMRVTEDDGTIDNDVPVLDKTVPISKFKFSDGFALVPDPAFVPKPKLAQMLVNNQLRRSTHGTILLRVYLPHSATCMIKGAPGMTLLDILKEICAKRNMSIDEYCFVNNQLPQDKHTDHDKEKHQEGGRKLTDGPGNEEQLILKEIHNGKLAPLPLDLVVDTLPSNELRLLNKESLHQKKKTFFDLPKEPTKATKDGAGQGTASVANASTAGGEDSSNYNFRDVFLTTMTALQYKEYDVIKINKHGHRDERIIGVDEERIYNHIRSPSLNKAKKGAKKPFRLIRDVEKCIQLSSSAVAAANTNAGAMFLDLGTKDAQALGMRDSSAPAATGKDIPLPKFQLVFNNGDKYEYELIGPDKSENEKNCAELVAKIRYLMDMARSKNQ